MKNIKFSKPLKILSCIIAGFFILFFAVPVLLIYGLNGFHPYAFYIDSCLDLGGRWNYEINDCEGSESYDNWKDRTWF